MDYVEESRTLDNHLEKLQDQLVLRWMLSSISAPALMSIVSCATSHDAWKTLREIYESDSEMCIFSLRQKLHTIKKGLKFVGEYMMEIVGISDSLVVASDQAMDRELVMSV